MTPITTSRWSVRLIASFPFDTAPTRLGARWWAIHINVLYRGSNGADSRTMSTPPETTAVGRRRIVTGGVATGFAAWATPTVLGFDSVAAAVGSCGIKPRRVDFTRWAGASLPTSFTSDDGAVTVGMTISDLSGVEDLSWSRQIYNGTLNGRDNPLIAGMNNATFGAGVELTFTFSVAVRPSFFLVDVDASTNNWRDEVTIRGSIGGGADFAPSTISPGPANTALSADTVQGVSSVSNEDGNVEIDFDQLVDTITILHADTSSWTAFQWVGIHDLHWC